MPVPIFLVKKKLKFQQQNFQPHQRTPSALKGPEYQPFINLTTTHETVTDINYMYMLFINLYDLVSNL